MFVDVREGDNDHASESKFSRESRQERQSKERGPSDGYATLKKGTC